ncbi:MAG: TetR/AcrR family transcriptional regulator [Deltaproteobacteria bacterium]|nr:TetR/AcrR family transcriptional regulator [Deltaproteobacteria bacterium]
MSSEGRKFQKRQRIIEAAARVFARKGFFNASVAEIAAEAGVGKGTLYEYVASKSDLFFAVFEWIAETSWTRARIGVDSLGAPASEKLRAMGRSLVEQWSGMDDYYGLVMEFWSASSSSELRDRFKGVFQEMYSSFRGIVSGLVREGMARGEFRGDADPEAVAAALVGTWDALILQAWFDETFDLETTTERFLSVVLQGLAARPDPPPEPSDGRKP